MSPRESTKLAPVGGLPDFAVIIRCIYTRGEDQTEALAELNRRRLWLGPEQRVAAGLDRAEAES